jgi:hypothetical protein
LSFHQAGNEDAYLDSHYDTTNGWALRFGTRNAGHAAADRMIIANGGNVGIGTMTPQALVHLSQSGPAVEMLRLDNPAGGTDLSNKLTFHQGGGENAYIDSHYDTTNGWSMRFGARNAGTSAADRMILTSNGNLGVGTITPTAKLHVLTAGNADGIAIEGTSNPSLNFRIGGAVGAYVGLATVGTAYFNDASANDVAIRSQTGNVLLGQCCAASAAIVRGTTNFTFPNNPLTLTLNGSAAFNVPSAGAGVNFNAIYNSSNQLATIGAISAIRESTADGNYAGALVFGTRTNGAGTQSMERMRIDSNGVVSINGSTLGSDHTDRLIVNGGIRAVAVIGATYQDFAEWVPASESMSAGTVVIVDESARNRVAPSKHAYDTAVAGVISAQPGVLLGAEGPSKVKVATTGRVKVHVDATRAPIRAGDLLVTSERPGIAMRSEPVDIGGVKIHRPGTLIGKALEPLESGEGEILVLLSLQ